MKKNNDNRKNKKKKTKLCNFGSWSSIKESIAFLANIITVAAFIFLFLELREGNEQTKLLKNQVFTANYLSIFQLGDRCMWNTPHGGDYDAYLLLKKMETDPLNKDIIDAIRNQIERVEKKYKAADIMMVYADKVIKAIWKYGAKDSDGEDVWAKIDTVDVNNIFEHMGYEGNRHLDTENIKAAYFMTGITPGRLKQSGRTWEDVFKTLIKAINDDAWCLYGRKMSLMAYCILAETSFPDKVFAFTEATNDWNGRKKEILEKKNKLLTTQSN